MVILGNSSDELRWRVERRFVGRIAVARRTRQFIALTRFACQGIAGFASLVTYVVGHASHAIALL
jgi:hypothetical protein